MGNRDVGVEYGLRGMATMIIAKAREADPSSELANAPVEQIMEILRTNTLPDFGIKIRKDRN
jgi:hypothetical protein